MRKLLPLVVLGLLTGACSTGAVAAQDAPPHIREFSAWLASSANAAGKPSAILDKKKARLYLFDASGRATASTPVLLGSAVGDESVPGIGDRKIKDIQPQERTTPAGRFVTEAGENAGGEDIVWVDYDAAISMHRVRAIKGESRLRRLATVDSKDNRISYGCINVPLAFYNHWINPSFGKMGGVIYILPETRSAAVQFKAPLSF